MGGGWGGLGSFSRAVFCIFVGINKADPCYSMVVWVEEGVGSENAGVLGVQGCVKGVGLFGDRWRVSKPWASRGRV